MRYPQPSNNFNDLDVADIIIKTKIIIYIIFHLLLLYCKLQKLRGRIYVRLESTLPIFILQKREQFSVNYVRFTYSRLSFQVSYGSLRNLWKHRKPKLSAQNLTISSPPLSLQSSSSISSMASSQLLRNPSQPSILVSETESRISCSPTIRQLTDLRRSRTAGSSPGTESSFRRRAIKASFIFSFSRSLLRMASTVSCRWIRRCRRSASELTAEIFPTRVRIWWAR